MISCRRSPKVLLSTVCLGAVLFLSACATKQLKPDFANFSEAYADNLNWQMLLNLARLDQSHPPYFMAIGEIRLGRTQSAGMNASGTRSRTTGETVAATVSRTATNVLSGTVSSSVSATASPTFLFIPINSDEAARQLLAPISIDVFNTLYQQGWPVDQLLRVLVERIEVEIHHGDRTEQVVLVNSPTRGTAESFARFLRVCEIVRELQKAGGLNLVAEERFMPLSSGEIANITSRDLTDAADKSRVWRRTEEGTWQLGVMRTNLRFRANQDIVEGVIRRFSVAEPDYRASLENLKAVLDSTLTADPGETPATATRSVLILRSFRTVLDAVAQEQRALDDLARDPSFAELVPARQLRPILRTDWAGQEGPFSPPATSLTYAGRLYQITDPVEPATELDGRWNRDVFRLLVQLSSQVTVDITRFQRQVLEVTQ